MKATKPKLPATPAAQKRLTGEALKMWKRIEAVIDLDDPFAVEAACQYCELHEVFIRAKHEFDQSKSFTNKVANGADQVHPGFKTMKECSSQMRMLSEIFRSKGKKTRKLTTEERFPT